jgi:hypothetical protein
MLLTSSTEENASASHSLASVLFLQEEWIHKEKHIWIAKSRLQKSGRERAKLGLIMNYGL